MSNWNQQPPPGEQPPSGSGLRLGPMTLADMLDGAFKILKTDWKALGTATLVYSAPLVFVSLLSSSIWNVGPDVFDSDLSLGAAIIGYLVLQFVIFLYTVFAYPLLSATIMRIAAASYMGASMPAKMAYRGVVKFWPALIGASLLSSIAVFFGLIACIIPGLFLGAIFALSTPIIAIEESGAINSLSRSYNLFKTRFWPYAGTLILSLIVGYIAGFILTIPLSIVGGIADAIGFDPLVWIVQAASTVAVNFVVVPFLAITTALIYFDARIRTEGFDLQVLATRLPGQQSVNPPPGDVPPDVPPGDVPPATPQY